MHLLMSESGCVGASGSGGEAWPVFNTKSTPTICHRIARTDLVIATFLSAAKLHGLMELVRPTFAGMFG